MYIIRYLHLSYNMSIRYYQYDELLHREVYENYVVSLWKWNFYTELSSMLLHKYFAFLSRLFTVFTTLRQYIFYSVFHPIFSCNDLFMISAIVGCICIHFNGIYYIKLNIFLSSPYHIEILLFLFILFHSVWKKYYTFMLYYRVSQKKTSKYKL